MYRKLRRFNRNSKTISATVMIGMLLLSTLLIANFSFVGLGFAQGDWWGAEWSYRKIITLNNTQVFGEQVNLPVLLNITDSDLAAKAQSNGDDIVFTDVNGTRLSHEIESYDGGTGLLVCWIKVPLLFATSDTSLYMYYGNSQASNQEDVVNVWDTNYSMVQHLDEASGTHIDSTDNNNDGTGVNGVDQSATGIIDGADYFDGSDDYINVSSSASLTGFDEAFTVSSWVKFNETLRRQTIVGTYDTAGNQRAWFFGIWNESNTYLELLASVNGNSTINFWRAPANITTTDWHYVSVVWESDTVPVFYLDGVLLNTWGSDTISSIYGNSAPLQIGQCTYQSGRVFNGTIDEVRISNGARSANWIETEYANQMSPSTFHSSGTEEQVVPYYISASSGSNGAVDPEGLVVVAEESNKTFAILPDNGYHISDVLVNGTSVGAVTTYTFTNVTANNTIEAQFVSNTPPTIQTNKASYERLQTVSITVTGGTLDDVVMIQIDGPSGEWWADQRSFASDGTFSYQLKIPGSWSYGTYTITVRDLISWTTRTKTFTVAAPSPPPPRPPGGGGYIPPSNKAPTAMAGLDQKTFVGHTIYFDGSASSDSDGTISEYIWIYGDGISGGEVSSSHIYSTPGLYEVKLIVYDNLQKTGEDKLNVTVIELPVDEKAGLDEKVEANSVDYVVDAIEETNTTVTVNTTKLVTITVIGYADNPYPEAELPEYGLPEIIDILVTSPEAITWPIYVERHYSDTDVASLNESRLVLYYYSDGEWHVCRETGVYPDRNVVWANMYEDELSGSPIIMAELPLPATFVVSNLTVTPSEVEPGQTVNVSVTIANVGRESGSYEAVLLVNGTVEDTQTISLDGESETSVLFQISKDAGGWYSVEIDGLESSFTVIIILPAEFEFSDLTITPQTIEPGEDLEISVLVSNVGTLEGSVEVDAKVDDNVVETQIISINGGDSQFVTFTVTSEDEGVHTVDVSGEVDTFTVATLQEPAEFLYTILNVIPVEVEPGETVTVNVEIENVGEATGTYAFDLLLDGEVADSKTGELVSGIPSLIEITVSAETEGTHIVSVNDATDTFTVTVPPEPEPQKLPWLWIDLLIVIIVAAVIYYLRRKGII